MEPAETVLFSTLVGDLTPAWTVNCSLRHMLLPFFGQHPAASPLLSAKAWVPHARSSHRHVIFKNNNRPPNCPNLRVFEERACAVHNQCTHVFLVCLCLARNLKNQKYQAGINVPKHPLVQEAWFRRQVGQLQSAGFHQLINLTLLRQVPHSANVEPQGMTPTWCGLILAGLSHRTTLKSPKSPQYDRPKGTRVNKNRRNVQHSRIFLACFSVTEVFLTNRSANKCQSNSPCAAVGRPASTRAFPY